MCVSVSVCDHHLVKVRMDQSHVVITRDDIPESRQPLLNSLYLHLIWQRVPQVLQLLCSDTHTYRRGDGVAEEEEGGVQV